MQQLFSPTTNPAVQRGQTEFVLAFKVKYPDRLFVVVSSQLQYLGVSYDMIGVDKVKLRFRLHGTETVEFFMVGGDGSIPATWLQTPEFFRKSPELPRPERPTWA